jgi:microcystin-dependent protein
MTLYKWSQTASADATADSTINWAEGQSPSSVNDSARAMMAAIAKYRDDLAGAIVTTGTSTAYAVDSYQGFQSLAQLNGQVIAFTPHATNGATVTINADALGGKPLRTAPNVELPAGVLIQGTPYVALYNNADQAFYLHGLFGNPYVVPMGVALDYFGTTAPNSSFALAYGQAISRTTYAALFALVGTTHGAGDGTTTFNIPDLRGRVVAGRDDMGGSAASRLSSTYFGGTATNLGAVGGAESNNVILTHNHGITDPGHTHTNSTTQGQSTVQGNFLYRGSANLGTFSPTTIDNATTGITINNAGSASAHNIVQPTIIANKLLRII